MATKKKSNFFSIVLILFLCCLIGISIGLGLFYSKIQIIPPSDISEITTEATKTVSNVFENVFSFLSSEKFTKFLPTLQGIITTVAASLGIIVTIKNLRKKN